VSHECPDDPVAGRLAGRWRDRCLVLNGSDAVNRAMSAALGAGLEVTGLGATLLFEQPRLLTMNVWGEGIVIAAAWSGIASNSQQPHVGSPEAAIVFVCEHGAAKSVIAATLFNKLAAEHGLRERAIYRGATMVWYRPQTSRHRSRQARLRPLRMSSRLVVRCQGAPQGPERPRVGLMCQRSATAIRPPAMRFAATWST
jgi:hypothetical protein